MERQERAMPRSVRATDLKQPRSDHTGVPGPASDLPPRPTAARDGLTTEQRQTPYTDDPALLSLEQEAAESVPDQLSLFAPGAGGRLTPQLGGFGPLEPGSSLEVARAWYRRELEQGRRPRNTIESYCYDLGIFQELIGAKPIDTIGRADVARFLGTAETRSTRKRRLTSLRRFFRFLIEDARVLEVDPAAGFYPHLIQLKTPVPLFPDEQAALLEAAKDDEPWAAPAIWLMMRLGLARAELLALRRDHVELTDPERPVVFIFYDDVTKRGKERKLAADAEFAGLYAAYLAAEEPLDLLFSHVPPSVNGMVERVRKAACITKEVTPQTLRHTYAVERAKAGADEQMLIALLGLADDPRNRASVARYLKLAAPPLE
jgi:integrase/recombinase XerD